MARHMSALVKQDLAKLGEDGESRRIAMNSLKSFVEQLDSSSIPRFLAQVAESRDQGVSRCYAISLYDEVARVHGKYIVPHVPRMMSTIIRFLSSSGSSLQLHQPCANVVVAMACYAIEPSTSALQAHAILTDICEPLLEVLVGTLEPLAAGAAICLQALVESTRWKCASTDLIHETCLRTTVALGDKATRTVGHMQLARALALVNGDVLGAYGLALLRSACQTLRTSTGNGRWHHRVSAARLLQAIVSKVDKNTFTNEVAYTTQILESFRHDRIPHVRLAIAETIQTFKSLASSENVRRSTKRDHVGISFSDSDYYKKPILKAKSWSHVSDGASGLKDQSTKSHISQVSQESQNISFSPSPSSSTPSDSTFNTTSTRPTLVSVPTRQKKNTRFPQAKLASNHNDCFSTDDFKALEEKENYAHSVEDNGKGDKHREEKLTSQAPNVKEKVKANYLEAPYSLHNSKYALSTQTNEAPIEPITISGYIDAEKAKWEENATILDKSNSILGLFDRKIPLYEEEDNAYEHEEREIGTDEEQVHFALLEDFVERRSFESMIHKERIGGDKFVKSLIIERDEICNVSLLEDDIYFLGDHAKKACDVTCEASKSTLNLNDCIYNAQKEKGQEDLDQAIFSQVSENAISSEELDSLAHKVAKGLELQVSTNVDKNKPDEARHDVEEIDLHTSSENGWSVHDNPIASDEGFEHEDPDSSALDLHCTSPESKIGSHSNSNICLSPTIANNELEYSSSGSNLHEQEHFMCEEFLRLDNTRSREGIKIKEESLWPSQLEILPASSSGRHMNFRSLDEVGGAIKHPSRSTHPRHVDSWPNFSRAPLKKRTKIRCKFSYSAFFFLERKNWTRVWSCMELLLGGSVCAALALPIALLVSTICYPLYLDYHFLVPT